MIKKILMFLCVLFVFSSCKQNKDSIIFSSSRNGNSDIYMMNYDGKNQIALTQDKSEEWSPTWINKNEISFLRQHKDSIYRIKLNLKTKVTSILEQPKNCILDDKNMLYSALSQYQLYACNNDIFLFDPKQNQLINITEHLNGKARYPSWSNDGKRVIYTSNHLGTNQIFSYEVDTAEVRQLTDTDANNERGELSPNNKLLAYSSDYFEKDNQEILVKNLETQHLENISKSAGTELIVRFSKDGKQLYYGSNKSGNWDIYAYHLETKTETPLTTSPAFDGDPRMLKVD